MGERGSTGWTNFESSNLRSLFWGLLTGDLVPLPPNPDPNHNLAPDKPLVRLGTSFVTMNEQNRTPSFLMG